MSRAVHLLVLGATLSTLGACSPPSAGPAKERSTASPPASTAELSADAARQKAVSTYRAMWDDFLAAGATSDWRAPGLGQHAAGIALDKLTNSLRADQEKGLVSKGSLKLNPEASTVDLPDEPRKVTVTDCGDSANALKYRKDNGNPADDVPGGKRRIDAIVEKQVDGTWKVTDFGVHDLGTC